MTAAVETGFPALFTACLFLIGAVRRKSTLVRVPGAPRCLCLGCWVMVGLLLGRQKPGFASEVSWFRGYLPSPKHLNQAVTFKSSQRALAADSEQIWSRICSRICSVCFSDCFPRAGSDFCLQSFILLFCAAFRSVGTGRTVVSLCQFGCSTDCPLVGATDH